MNKDAELYDKVIYYMGRIWTIYASSGNDGVFAYQGLKPYETFKYDSERSDRNLSYLKMDEALKCIVEGNDQIAEFVKTEKIAEAKKFNKKMAVEFFVYLTGHAKTKINSDIVERHNGFTIVLGHVCYDLWKSDGKLHLNHNMHGNTTGTAFDYITWKHDSKYEDVRNKEHKQEIIEAYKEQYNCSCDRK